MRSLFAALLICLCVLAVRAQDSLLAPPNTIRFSSDLYIDKTEIANIHWLEYLHYLEKDSGKVYYKNALPDTSVWLAYGDSLRWKHYLRYPAYRYFPVVGVTQAQAINYCRWRSEVVSAKISSESEVSFVYRLPSEAEWNRAASGDLDIQRYPFGYEIIYGSSSLVMRKSKQYFKQVNKEVEFRIFKRDLKSFIDKKEEIKFNVIKSFEDYFQYGDYAPAYIYDKRTQPNRLGLYHMIGNVAEMTDQPGVAKGGSWFHYSNESTIENKIPYFKPEAWLGFRCVCEVYSD